MNKLDALWKYQQAELAAENLENKVKATPARMRLNKLHAYLSEQQNSISATQKNIENRRSTVESLSAQVDDLMHKYELEVSEFGAMENDDEVTAAEMTESRKSLENLMARMDSARRELFDTIAWIEKATVDYKDNFSRAAKAKKEYDATRADCEAELLEAKPGIDEANKRKDAAAEDVDPELMERYKKIKSHHQAPMAKVENNQCGGCNMSLPTSTIKRVAAGQEIVECENCGRILYTVD